MNAPTKAHGRAGVSRLLGRPRLMLSVAVLWTAMGLAAWWTMPREEDPRLSGRWAMVLAPFPGADAATAERLVLEPIEERLAEIAAVKRIDGTARADVVIIQLELHGDVDDTDAAWDEVRRSLAEVATDLPEGAVTPTLDDDVSETDAVVLAVTGSDDPLLLRDAATTVKAELLRLRDVSRVELVADPGEQVTIAWDAGLARRLGLDPQLLVGQLAQRNRVVPGGAVAVGGRRITVRPGSEFASLADVRTTPIVLPSGAAVPLAALTEVRLGPAEPAAARMRFRGEPAVGVTVVARPDIDLVAFGADVRAALADLAPRVAPLAIEEVAFQPDHVEARLSGLGRSLLLGMLIVAGVLFAAMGLRVGIVVALVIPSVALASLAIYALGGGVLHQISISALVIALGMLVDNAIVVTESIQAALDGGADPDAAAQGAVRELALPLGTATGTTLAAFVPMLLATGPTAEFTAAIPIVIMLTLVVSYLFALFVTPLLARAFLRRRTEAGEGPLARAAGALGRLAVRRRGLVALVGAAAVAASLAGMGALRQQFFPKSDRAVVVLDVALPEGAHLDETDAVVRGIEDALSARPDVAGHASFVGRSAAHFYYNLPNVPVSPQFAQVVLFARDLAATDDLVAWTERTLQPRYPQAALLARGLEQGPPVAAPVVVRVQGQDLVALQSATDDVVAALRETPGAREVRHDLGVGAPTLAFRVDDASAARSGLSRADVALGLLETTRGLPVGELRSGDDPVPVVVRSSAGERTRVDELVAIDVGAPGRPPVPLAQVAVPAVSWRPAAIRHRDRSRVATVTAWLAPDATYAEVLDRLAPRLDALTLPPGVRLGLGGAVEGSGEANASMLAALPIGLLLLLVMLLAEFNSFRRVGLVLVTVPLAAAGVVPGLLLSGEPFGFMSLLGVFALVGIVVNNAIVLLDVVERRRREGASISDAVVAAVRTRTRPILLTSATTVAGLLPLALSGTSLWPPMAWAMISGLLASTLLTLLVVPALYVLLFRERGPAPAAPPETADSGRASGTADPVPTPV